MNDAIEYLYLKTEPPAGHDTAWVALSHIVAFHPVDGDCTYIETPNEVRWPDTRTPEAIFEYINNALNPNPQED